MCKLRISGDGTLFTDAIIRISALNFVAPLLKRNELVLSIKPVEQTIQFVVDTGADITCISALDAIRLGIETRYLEPDTGVLGVGGKCRTFKLRKVEIGLIDEVTKNRIRFHIEELEYACVMAGTGIRMPSLLGNDILKRFDISTHRESNYATLKRIPAASEEFRIVSKGFT